MGGLWCCNKAEILYVLENNNIISKKNHFLMIEGMMAGIVIVRDQEPKQGFSYSLPSWGTLRPHKLSECDGSYSSYTREFLWGCSEVIQVKMLNIITLYKYKMLAMDWMFVPP